MRFAWLKTERFANPSVEWLREFGEECSDEFVWNSFLATDLHFSSLPVLSQSLLRGEHSAILQVEVKLNISDSVYSQVNALKDSINHIEERKIELEEGNSSITAPTFNKYILSDGQSAVWALILASGEELPVEEGAKILVKPQDLRYFELEKTLVLNKIVVLSRLRGQWRSEKEKLDFLVQFLNNPQ